MARFKTVRPRALGPRYPMRFVKALRLCCSGAGLQFLIYATKLEAFVCCIPNLGNHNRRIALARPLGRLCTCLSEHFALSTEAACVQTCMF